MSLDFKILPALALAVALSPLAAQAAQNAQPAQQTVHVSAIMVSSATLDNPTTVYGGVGVNSFLDSFGG
jgi:hypothetical protein